jgi:hypothetical protein
MRRLAGFICPPSCGRKDSIEVRPRELLEDSVARAQNNEGRRIMPSKADCLGIRLPVCSVPAEAYDLIINDYA